MKTLPHNLLATEDWTLRAAIVAGGSRRALLASQSSDVMGYSFRSQIAFICRVMFLKDLLAKATWRLKKCGSFDTVSVYKLSEKKVDNYVFIFFFYPIIQLVSTIM